MQKKRFALVSVYDKNNLDKICELFKKYNIEIISTSTTSRYIKKIGYKCQEVSNFIKFKEILDGRVKTLHPLIHASLLFDRNNKNHSQTFKKLNFPEIDFLIINLYPFESTLNKKLNFKKIIEFIDIGGTALLRSAAKNFKTVTAICNILDYEIFKKNMVQNKGKTSFSFRKHMAAKIFDSTSSYDKIISNWINKNKKNIKILNHEKKYLRYGENPHQKSYFYQSKSNNHLYTAAQIKNKSLSYNNILDIDAAYNCIREFEKPTCVIIKHNTPCGVASDTNIYRAFNKAFDADNVSAFGGIVALNRKVNEKIAKLLITNFFEIIIAPDITTKSKKILEKKEKLIFIKSKKIKNDNNLEIKSVNWGFLIQEKNTTLLSKKIIKCVSNKKATEKQINDLIFALKVAKHAKSNAIVIANNYQTIGVGTGQTSRIESTKIALSKISNKKKKLSFVAASDAFFPFTDSIKLLIKKNCKAIIQPSGSINDKKIIDFCNFNKISLYFTNFRFFKH